MERGYDRSPGGTSGQLSETGWTDSSNTNSSAGDAPQSAINGTGAAVSSTAAGPSDVVSCS